MNENTQTTHTPTVSTPRFWIGLLFAVLPFVLILVIPTPSDYKIVEIIYPDGSRRDITPPHPYALYAAAFVVLGWAYWLYCVYRVHKVMAEATNVAHSIAPNKAALFHLIPVFNLYWVFKWTHEIAKSVHNHANRFMQGGIHGTFLLVALVIVYAGLMPPSAVLAHATALAIAVVVGLSVSRHVRAMTSASVDGALNAVIIIFNRDFSPKETIVNSILTKMSARGRPYCDWMNENTPLHVLLTPRAQDPVAFAAIGMAQFRRLIGDRFDVDKMEHATFEGSDGISGVILTHWDTRESPLQINKPLAEDAVERPKVKEVSCGRCNRLIMAFQIREGDRLWCSCCNDWALYVGTSGEGKSGQRNAPAAPSISHSNSDPLEELLAIYEQNREGFAPGFGNAQAYARVKQIGKALDEAGGMDRMLEVHAEFARRSGVMGAPRNLEHAWDGIGDWLG